MTRDRTKAWPDPCKQEAPAFPLWATGHRPAFLKGCGRWWAVTTIFRDVMIFQKKIHEIYFMVIYFMRLMMMMMINNQHHHVQKQLQSCLSTGNGQAHVFRTLCANSLGICSTKKESSRQLGGEPQSHLLINIRRHEVTLKFREFLPERILRLEQNHQGVHSPGAACFRTHAQRDLKTLRRHLLELPSTTGKDFVERFLGSTWPSSYY